MVNNVYMITINGELYFGNSSPIGRHLFISNDAVLNLKKDNGFVKDRF